MYSAIKFKVQFSFNLQNLNITWTKVFMIFVNQIIKLICYFEKVRQLNWSSKVRKTKRCVDYKSKIYEKKNFLEI